jgi:hypothetical protein
LRKPISEIQNKIGLVHIIRQLIIVSFLKWLFDPTRLLSSFLSFRPVLIK